MNKKTFSKISTLLLAIMLVSVSTAYVTVRVLENKKKNGVSYYAQPSTPTPVSLANYQAGAPVDFTYAAERSIHAVVHVEIYYDMSSRYGGRQQGPSLWDFFFGDPFDSPYGGRQPYSGKPESQGEIEKVPQGAGSGVIISTDGYIVTNNHVIDKASEVKVTLNNKQSYTAKVIGTDPSTDIALLKIEANDLEFLSFGSSDDLKVGEWVLAVGNPFNLTSTVTAGIVSAKGRNIGIIPGDMRIESFIQTDAAVNPGNSGGALVNTRGELIGINTAIASRTGNFTGYSFAVPSGIVNKVVDDLKQFGVVQRALLGIEMRELNAETAKELSIDTKDYKGVVVMKVRPESAAEKAGVEQGDIITHINGVAVNGSSDVQEQISRYRPNDKINITILRKGNVKQLDVVLRNKLGSTSIVNSDEELISSLGATFKELTDKEKSDLGLRYGVKVADVAKGKKFQAAGIKKGYIITRINRQPIHSVESIKKALSTTENGIVLIEGMYPNGDVVPYVFRLAE